MMARQRMVNPAFFVDEDVAKVSPLARLLFIGMWTLADKRGRLEDRPARIRVQVLPYDSCDVDGLLSELVRARFIVRYSAEFKSLIQIRSFEKYQKPHPKEPETAFPGPPELAVEKPGPPELAVNVRSESESLPSESESVVAPAPLVAPALAWNREAADDFREVYGSDPPKGKSGDAYFAAVKRVAQKYGWARTRPALRAYMAETPIEYLNVAKCLAAKVEGRGPARARGQPVTAINDAVIDGFMSKYQGMNEGTKG